MELIDACIGDNYEVAVTRADTEFGSYPVIKLTKVDL